ncbi:hypothetical protein BGZ73_009240 [Actinomortierella ambigua]|nr:hypothetical protein BGZ73_009240 [Actinomortierella ambigua]
MEPCISPPDRKTIQNLSYSRRLRHSPLTTASPASSLLILGVLAHFGLLSYNNDGSRQHLHFAHAQRTSGGPRPPVTTQRPPATVKPPPILPSRTVAPVPPPPATFTIRTIVTTTTTTKAHTTTQSHSPSGESASSSATGPSGTPYSNKLPASGDTTTMLIITLAIVFGLLGGVVIAVCWLLRRRNHKRRMNIAVVKSGGSGAWDGNAVNSKNSDKRQPNAPMTTAKNDERQLMQQVHDIRRTSTLSMGTGAGTGTLHGSGFESGGEKMVEHYRHSGDLSSLPIEIPTTSLDLLHPSDPEGRRRSNISVRSSTPSQYRPAPPSMSPHPSMHRNSTISYHHHHSNSNPYGGGAGNSPYYAYGGMTNGPNSRAQSPHPGFNQGGRSSMDVSDSHGEFYAGPEGFRNSHYDRPHDPSAGMSPPALAPSPYYGGQPPHHHQYHHHSGSASPYGYNHPHQGGRPLSGEGLPISRSPSMTPGSSYIPPPHHQHHYHQQQQPTHHNPHHRYSQQLPSPHLSYQQGPRPQPMDRSKTVSYRHSQPYNGMMSFQPSSPYHPSPASPGALHPQTGTVVFGNLGIPSMNGGSGGSISGGGGHGTSDSETIASSNSGSGVSKTGSNAAVMIRPKGITNGAGGGSSHTFLSSSTPASGSGGSGSQQGVAAGTSPSASSLFTTSTNSSNPALGGSVTRLESAGSASTGLRSPNQLSPRSSVEFGPGVVVAGCRRTNSSSVASAAAVTIAPPPQPPSSAPSVQQQTLNTSSPGEAEPTNYPVHSMPFSESKEELTDEAIMEESFQITVPHT